MIEIFDDARARCRTNDLDGDLRRREVVPLTENPPKKMGPDVDTPKFLGIYRDQHPMAEHTTDPRRSFLKLLTGGFAAVIGAMAAIPGLRFLAHPLVKETVTGGDEPLHVALKDEVDPGRPKRVNVIGQTHDGWLKSDGIKLGACWLVKSSAESEVRAYSTVCPHLGCGIDWNDATKKFDCPCHGSVFDLEGRCVEGPSPRGMDELEVVTSGEEIKVKYRRFRVSIPNKEPLG